MNSSTRTTTLGLMSGGGKAPGANTGSNLETRHRSAFGTGQARLTKPIASSKVVSTNMKRQKSKDTQCELAVRRHLHSAGLRYRVDFRPLQNQRFRADIGWKSLRLAVFIDGCFWHGCPLHGTTPRSNTEWWAEKLSKNKQRDIRVVQQLEDAGWTVVRFWEHEPAEIVAAEIISLVSTLRHAC